MRIVVRCQEAQAARAAQERLAAAEIEAVALPGAPEPYRAAPNGEDIVIVDLTDGDVARGEAMARATMAAQQRPMAVLAGLTSARPPAPGLDALPHFSGAVALDAPAALLAAQLSAFTRMIIAEEERARRVETAIALDITLPKPSEQRRLKALYIGAPSPVFLSLERAFAAHGGLVTAAFTSFSGFDHLHDEFFDAVVLNGAQDPVTAVALCAALRRNASLNHLPTLMVTAAGDETTARAAIARGACAIVAVNAPSAPAMGWLFEAVRRERRRKAAEHDIRALRDLMGDPRTGLFRRAPFEAHLARMADEHHGSGRSLAIAVLRVMPAHGASMPSDAAWRRGFGEISSLAGRLVRDADTVTALGRDLIVVALPATTLLGARRAAERIASVAECTAFAAGDNGVPIVFEQSAAELQPGESGAALLARAARVLEAESVTA